MTEIVIHKKTFDKEVLSSWHHVDVHLGDATLYASLISLKKPDTAVVVIDPNIQTSEYILQGLKEGIPIFDFLEHIQTLQRDYFSIYQQRKMHSKVYETLQREYHELWQSAQCNLDNLFLIDHSIEEILTQLTQQMSIADTVTYQYPSPIYNPRFSALALSSKILKPEGTFTITSENSGVTADFARLAGKYTQESGYVIRNCGQYVSAYDILWGNHGHYETKIINRNDGLSKFVEQVSKSYWFKAQSFLGMIH